MEVWDEDLTYVAMGKYLTISLQTLYDKFQGELENGTIEKSVDGEWEYYDLCTGDGTVCMDGETCEIIEEREHDFVLLNKDGEQDTTFVLTREEIAIGAFWV